MTEGMATTIVREADARDFLRLVNDRNLLAQYDILEVFVYVALEGKLLQELESRPAGACRCLLSHAGNGAVRIRQLES